MHWLKYENSRDGGDDEQKRRIRVGVFFSSKGNCSDEIDGDECLNPNCTVGEDGSEWKIFMRRRRTMVNTVNGIGSEGLPFNILRVPLKKPSGVLFSQFLMFFL